MVISGQSRGTHQRSRIEQTKVMEGVGENPPKRGKQRKKKSKDVLATKKEEKCRGCPPQKNNFLHKQTAQNKLSCKLKIAPLHFNNGPSLTSLMMRKVTLTKTRKAVLNNGESGIDDSDD